MKLAPCMVKFDSGHRDWLLIYSISKFELHWSSVTGHYERKFRRDIRKRKWEVQETRDKAETYHWIRDISNRQRIRCDISNSSPNLWFHRNWICDFFIGNSIIFITVLFPSKNRKIKLPLISSGYIERERLCIITFSYTNHFLTFSTRSKVYYKHFSGKMIEK